MRKVRPSNELVQAQDPNKSVPEGDNDRPRPKEQGAGSVSLLSVAAPWPGLLGNTYRE